MQIKDNHGIVEEIFQSYSDSIFFRPPYFYTTEIVPVYASGLNYYLALEDIKVD